MKSSILVARIMRVIETDGMIGDGAGLAGAFDQAVKTVNARLESVQAAVSSGQMSDAVRQMEDPPRLLDEINSLDFNRLPDWKALCERNGWTMPIPFDRVLVEKTLLLGTSLETAEPFLKMYRKAVRTNNNALAVRALRRLAEVDHSQNWEENLIQAEAVMQRQLLGDFASAKVSGDEEAIDRIAREVLETQWRSAPKGQGLQEIRAYWEGKEARRREAEGAENLTLLRRCHDENWNRGLAFSMIQAIDLLTDNGWNVPPDDQSLVDECRRRVAEEMEVEEKENRWRACCEVLHSAIQREDTMAIREALAAPEFFDREPSEDLLRDAQRVIDHEEAAKRRKVLQIAVCSLLALVAVLGVSGWWLRQKLFSLRCEGEAAKLATLEKGSHAIDRIGEALRRLEGDEPEVYADPRVNVYVGKLKTMIAKNLARTNEITSLLAELTVLRGARWTNATDAVTGQLARVEALLTGDDTEYRKALLSVKTAYNDHLEANEDARKARGTKRYETLTARMRDCTQQLQEVIGGEEQDKAVAVCNSDMSEWRADFGGSLSELDAKLSEVEKALLEAVTKQKNVRDALGKLKSAEAAPEVLEARKALIEFYSSYPEIKRMGELQKPVDVGVVREMLEGKTAEQKTFADAVNVGIPPDKFKAFLEENVSSFSEIPSFYSLYGVTVEGSDSCFAISKGKPSFKKPTYAKEWLIEGDLLDCFGKKMVDKIEKKNQNIRYHTIQSVDEVKDCVDIASRSTLTIWQFEDEILKLIRKHIDGVHDKQYLENERKFGRFRSMTKGRYTAFRHVIMLDIYFRWLKDDLKLMPPDSALVKWVTKAETLSQAVHVDGVPDDLSWVCVWEGRVSRRNDECIRFLEQLPSDWVERYRRWRLARSAMKDVSKWKVESAGQLLFDPRNPHQKKDIGAVIPIVLSTVKKDHPLYVLREEGGRLLLKKALVPQKNAWAKTADVKTVPGEPLYQIVGNGRPIDVQVEIAKLVNEVPDEVMRQFAAKMPFFEVAVSKEERK